MTAACRSEQQLVAVPAQESTANMSEEKHSWDRVPAWNGDKRQWRHYLRDVELYLETEKLDVDFSHGGRLLSRLTVDAERVKTKTLRVWSQV